MARRDRITIEQLRKLEPLSALSGARLEELVPLTDIEKLSIGQCLFREGDVDNQTIYLLDGDVQMQSSDGKLDFVFRHQMEEARFPLDDSQPRQVTCTALTKVKLARIDNSVLEYMMMWDQMAVSEQAHAAPAVAGQKPEPAHTTTMELTVPLQEDETIKPFPVRHNPETKESGEDRSWIRKIRQVMAFKNLPPANIKSLLERMETIQVKAGESIIKQGDTGDYYYVLTDGKASVTRIVELATLEGGASFGEEALLCGGTRNASVTMLSDGSLMRLAKQDFDELLKEH
ncbi:MAG: cyclic nucleotide-binding domain-containing protein, partial [Gammaproteobacteria bacterium]|nr:cyclic nucleotide-binding domain-containing protein [Gammaproteobacteria bacterium]